MGDLFFQRDGISHLMGDMSFQTDGFRIIMGDISFQRDGLVQGDALSPKDGWLKKDKFIQHDVAASRHIVKWNEPRSSNIRTLRGRRGRMKSSQLMRNIFFQKGGDFQWDGCYLKEGWLKEDDFFQHDVLSSRHTVKVIEPRSTILKMMKQRRGRKRSILKRDSPSRRGIDLKREGIFRGVGAFQRDGCQQKEEYNQQKELYLSLKYVHWKVCAQER